MSQFIASFDIGGTNMRAATVELNEAGAQIVHQTRKATLMNPLKNNTGATEQLEDVWAFIEQYVALSHQDFGTRHISVALPGPVDAQGSIRAMATILGTYGDALCPIPASEILSNRLPGFEIHVMNDVTAAGYRFVPESRSFALFTLGSGIGLKVFIDGAPQLGPSGLGGELTHMVFDTSPHAPMCDCGGQGHLGALASGRAWQKHIEEAKANGQSADLFAFAEPLARAIAMLHYSIGLERFVFGGGLSEGLGEPLRKAIVLNLPKQGWNTGQDWDAMVCLAPNDDSHALLGGAMSFMNITTERWNKTVDALWSGQEEAPRRLSPPIVPVKQTTHK